MPFAIQNPVAENLNRDRRTDIGDLAFHRQNDMVILLQQTDDCEIGLLRRQGSAVIDFRGVLDVDSQTARRRNDQLSGGNGAELVIAGHIPAVHRNRDAVRRNVIDIFSRIQSGN